jgi:ribosomal peptide maturation radical SAM protein 1
VLLIAMPWQALHRPSIQLGTLQSALERAGIPTEVRSLWLAFMEHCLAETAPRPDPDQIRPADYVMVAEPRYNVGLGDWIFGVPPFRESLEGDKHYLSYLRSCAFPESDIAKALTMRALVPAFLERCLDEILTPAPRVVGFTSTFSQNVPSLVLAKLLKLRDPSVKIVFGGANCDGPMGAALHNAFPWIDVVVRGEGERVLPEVVRDLLGGQPVRPQPGLCYREDGRSIVVKPTGSASISMDEVPTPIYDEYFERLDKTSFRTGVLTEVRLPYEAARGCWWGEKSHCTFCGLNASSMAFRSKSPTRVVEELIALARRYGRLDFQVVDTIMDLRYLREVLPRVREAGYDLSLFYEMKANLTGEQVRLLRDSAVNRIEAGIESLSTPILRLIRKGVTAFQNVRLLKWCAQYGVQVFWNVIYGLPGEPPEEYARMAGDVLSLTHLAPPNLVPLSLDRFSPYHERPQDFGLELLGPLPWYRMVYPVEPATLADLAYVFEHRHADGRNPETYVEPLRRAIETWQANGAAGYRSLRYRRGPGFLVIHDRRPNIEAADYTLGEREAQLYLACEDGATPAEASQALRSAGGMDVSPGEVREYLDALVAMRLVYKEDDRYLTLALPAMLPEEACLQNTFART